MKKICLAICTMLVLGCGAVEAKRPNGNHGNHNNGWVAPNQANNRPGNHPGGGRPGNSGNYGKPDRPGNPGHGGNYGHNGNHNGYGRPTPPPPPHGHYGRPTPPPPPCHHGRVVKNHVPVVRPAIGCRVATLYDPYVYYDRGDVFYIVGDIIYRMLMLANGTHCYEVVGYR